MGIIVKTIKITHTSIEVCVINRIHYRLRVTSLTGTGPRESAMAPVRAISMMPYSRMTSQSASILFCVPVSLDDDVIQRHIHDVGAEDVDDIDDVAARLARRLDLDEHEAHALCVFLAEVDNLDDIDELTELLDDLIEFALRLHRDDDIDARDFRLLRVASGDALDIEGAPADGTTCVRTPGLCRPARQAGISSSSIPPTPNLHPISEITEDHLVQALATRHHRQDIFLFRDDDIDEDGALLRQDFRQARLEAPPSSSGGIP